MTKPSDFTPATPGSGDGIPFIDTFGVPVSGAERIVDFDNFEGALTLANQIGYSGLQPIDATLTSIALLGTTADVFAYTTDVDTWAETALTAFARTLLDDTTQGAAQTTLGLGTGDTPEFTGLTLGGVVVPTISSTSTLTNKTLDSFTNNVHADDIHVEVRNSSGATLTAGTAVYVSGYNVGQDLPEVQKADAATALALPCIGIVDDDILNNANGGITSIGRLDGLDMSAFAVGDILYLSTTAGELVNTKPTANEIYIQIIGEVLRSHATLGVLEIHITGHITDFPNWLSDDRFRIVDQADITKVFQFQVSGVTTGTARTVTVLDADGTMVLEAATQTLTNKTIDGDNNTISNLAHGAEVDNPSSGVHGVTGSVVGTTDTQTLTSKTLTSPVLTTPQINDTSLDHQYIFGVSELVADRTVTLPLLTGNDTFTFNDFAATLTNKTIDSAANTLTLDMSEGTLTGTEAEFQTALSDGTFRTVGKDTIWIPATAMTAQITNGAASGSSETTTNDVMIETFDFDQTTDEFTQFSVAFPKSWNEGTVTAQFFWSAGVTGNVIWGCQAMAIANDDLLDTAFGTAQTVTDGVTATTDLMISAETTAITIAGSPGVDELVYFRFFRDANAGGDTAAGDALLIGVKIIFTTDAANDD